MARLNGFLCFFLPKKESRMEKQAAPICAAIDVGSNTIHIVVARCFPDTLEILADELDLTRIGASVTATGKISPAKTQAALQTLKAYQELAGRYGAEQVFVVATEAIRQAENRDEFLAQVRAETGLEIRLISGTVEATLTFLGATYEAGSQKQLGVMDLGGGSLELVFARSLHIVWRTSLPIGSGWLHDQYLWGNPPTSNSIQAAETFLQTYLRSLKRESTASPLIVTGGSANSLLLLARRAFSHPPESTRLSRENLLRCQSLLSALPAEEIASRYDQPLARARILLAGTLIIKHVMQKLGVQEIVVSPHGIREGVLLAYARYQDRWPEEIERVSEEGMTTFAQSARHTLVERLHAFLAWRDEVLKHEDSEAVHKMRVASRRLRAALDAYQSCCNPKRFARVYRRIKRMASLLGEARDSDVMLQYLCEQWGTLSEDEQQGVRWLITNLREYRQQKQQELDAFLYKLDAKKLERTLKNCVQERIGE
jgi:exopolyphosphatase/pppGpp-phosphohydrolase